jgi:hypothetical protein
MSPCANDRGKDEETTDEIELVPCSARHTAEVTKASPSRRPDGLPGPRTKSPNGTGTRRAPRSSVGRADRRVPRDLAWINKAVPH